MQAPHIPGPEEKTLSLQVLNFGHTLQSAAQATVSTILPDALIDAAS